MQMKLNAVNQAGAGECFLHQGDEVKCICMVLKGKAVAKKKGVNLSFGAGNFPGLNDLYLGNYLCDYVATEPLTFFAFPTSETKGIKHILTANRDYGGLMVWAFSKIISELSKAFDEICKEANLLGETVVMGYQKYTEDGKALGFTTKHLAFVEELTAFALKKLPDMRRIQYYTEASKIPLEKHKAYFLDSVIMSEQQIEEATSLVNALLDICGEAAEYLEDVFFCLMNNSDQNLFCAVAQILMEANQKDLDTIELSSLLDDLTDRINQTERFFYEKLAMDLQVDRNRMEEIYFSVLSGTPTENTTAQQEESHFVEIDEEQMNRIQKLLDNSLAQIFHFSEFEEKKAQAFSDLIEQFIALPDRLSIDEKVRKLKREINKHFFDLYQEVFQKAYGQKSIPLAVELFLKFAFVDERLVSPEHLREFCSYQKEKEAGPCEVYTIYEWLCLIYEGKKEPSKSELDQSFEENLRDMKKRGLLTDEQMRQRATDRLARLEFEIHNMFTSNDRLVNGQISTFVPILYTEGLGWQPSKAYRTKKQINECVEKILQKDPTAFHREVLYRNPEEGIEKEFIQKQVFPEIILMPTNGAKAIMWQEITGKRRDSAGRFLLPHLFEGDLEEAMVPVIGRFRWEMCRTIMGPSWNNIQIKSLTSEFSDYFQYYRKNHDLSEEKREKVKLQLQKARGSEKEAFVQDYEVWVRYESAGAVRLNKVAREMLATYCPFGQETRKALASQPIFEDAFGRFERTKSKKTYELSLKYRAMEKERGEVPSVIKEMLQFYKNL